MKVKANSQNQSSSRIQFTGNDIVYKLNLMSRKWEVFSELKSKRCGHQSTIIGDKMYLVGGYNGFYSADTEVIPIRKKDQSLDSMIPAMHYKRKFFGMCSFVGCIFVAGGKPNTNKVIDKCEIYSIESRHWIEASSMNTKRSKFALVYFEDKIWAIGGRLNKTPLDSIETYDLAKNKWTNLDIKLLTKRSGHSAVVHNKKFFVIGGFHYKAPVKAYSTYPAASIEVYSSETNQFTFVSQMVQPRAYFGCSIFNNNLIVYGGRLNKIEVTDSVEIYDIENQVWSQGPNLPLLLAECGCATTN